MPARRLKKGFVDSLLYEDQMEDVFADLGVESDGGDYRFVTLGEYASQVGADLKTSPADQVAIVYADGQIVDGEGYGKEIYGNTLAAKLADVRRDEQVKAVVVRVNSPGRQRAGFGCDLARDGALRAEKPVIALDGLLCGQRRILHLLPGRCDRGRPADADRFDRSLRDDPRSARCPSRTNSESPSTGVQSNASSDFSGQGPLTPVQRAMIMRGVDRVNGEGRNLPAGKKPTSPAAVSAGYDVLEVGLIDTYGGLKTAIACWLAVDKAESRCYRSSK